VSPEREVLARLGAVEKRVGARAILTGVDLAVHVGEIVTLIGPNGAGKTTLIRVLLGLSRPDRGEVWLRPGLRVGYAPQHFAVDRILPLPVRRFLELAGRPTSAQIADALGEVGAAGVIGAPLHAISGGELRRVLLARALLRDPHLLVLDEPIQGVDIVGQHELFKLIVGIRQRRGCGVLMVSHDLHLVMAATDTVVCLNGHVCCTGHPESVSRDPAYLALFGPAVADSLAVYTHHHDHSHDAGGRVVEHADHHHG
jgi:zinc transport system ATP-binding protein